jgi:two-component system, OmpR family, sensor histidine kinase KdpD
MADTKDAAPASPGPVVAALDGGPEGREVVLSASSLARGLGASWDCLTIDAGRYASAEEGERLERAQRQAASLGARVSSRANADPAAGILAYARERGASAIVVGKGRRRIGRRGILDLVLESAGGTPVLAVGPRRAGRGPWARRRRPGDSPSVGYTVVQYLAALLVVAALTGINVALTDYAGYWAAAIPYLAGISLMALVLDRAPVLFAALLSAAAWDFFFIPPRYTFVISRTEDILMLGLYFFVAICSGWLTGRLSANERLLAAREGRMSRLSELASALAGARGLAPIVEAGVEALEAAFDAEATIILREGAGELKAEAETGWEPLDENARAAARLCLDMAKSAGRYTEDFEASEWHFVPMESPRGCIGVIGLRPAKDRAWSQDTESYLRTIERTLSIAISRVFPPQV